MKIFIGSSSESLNHATVVAAIIDKASKNNEYCPVIWNDVEVFRPGKNTIENLLNASENYDAGVFIFSEDDVTKSRGSDLKSVRDNVLFEYGLFLGAFKGKNVIICRSGNPKQIIDLEGITFIDLNKKYDAERRIIAWLGSLRIDKAADNYLCCNPITMHDSIQFPDNFGKVIRDAKKEIIMFAGSLGGMGTMYPKLIKVAVEKKLKVKLVFLNVDKKVIYDMYIAMKTCDKVIAKNLRHLEDYKVGMFELYTIDCLPALYLIGKDIDDIRDGQIHASHFLPDLDDMSYPYAIVRPSDKFWYQNYYDQIQKLFEKKECKKIYPS